MSKPMTQVTRELLELPMAEASLEDLRSLFLKAAKPDTQWLVGAEFECFAVHREDGRPAEHATLSELVSALGRLGEWEEETEHTGEVVGLKGDMQSVSLEPGGQLEFATRPYRALRSMRDEILGFTRDLKDMGAARGLEFWCLGHQPFVHLDDVPRMPKARYDRMRSFMAQRGPRALEMMHLTGSIQCALDFSDETNLTNKIRTAAKVSPYLSALVAASPFTRGRPNGFKSLRYQIWLETDDDRCGIWPEMLDATGLNAERYIERALRTPAMFIMRDGRYLKPDERPFRQLAEEGFEGQTIRVQDFLDHLTSFFPEVRVKNYIELRGADCLRPEFVSAVAGFWRGLLDDEATRMEVDQRLACMDYHALRALQPQVARYGLQAESPAGQVLEVIRWLVDKAYHRLLNGSPDCAHCLQTLKEQAERGRSPADEMLEVARTGTVRDALRLVTL